MGKPTLVVAIRDEHYLFPLELALAEKVYESAEMEAISDPAYFEEYFTAPRTVDLLIVDEFFCKADLKRHNVKKTFLLTEEMDEEAGGAAGQQSGPQQFARIFKYLTLSVLISSIIPPEWGGSDRQDAGTQIIAVISAQGGAGCTTVALGVAACLRQSLKRTLYVNTETFQSFHRHLANRTEMTMGGCARMRSPSPRLYTELKAELQREQFSFLPPLPSSRYALGIGSDSYIQFVKAAQASGDFDKIVLDVGDELTPDNIPLLDAAAKVLIVCRQEEDAAFKMRVLMHNISCRDKDKFFFVCNHYRSGADNAFVSGEFAGMMKIDEYVAQFPQPADDVRSLAKNEGLQKVAYALM